MLNHNHSPGSLQIDEGGAHSHFWYGYNNVDGGTDAQVRSRRPISGDPPDFSALNDGLHSHTISGATAWVGGNETRPLNAYVNYIIKY
jgi:hypothetical protein